MDRREGKHKNTLRLGGTGTGRYSDPGRSCKAAIHNLPEVRSSRYVSVKGFGADGLGCGAKSSLLFQMLPLSLVLIEAMIMYNTHTLLKVRERQGMCPGPRRTKQLLQAKNKQFLSLCL